MKLIALCLFTFLSLAPGLEAGFLDSSLPARAAAMGGNLAADADGSAALSFNPAGLGYDNGSSLWARYQSLFSGIQDDSLGTASLSLRLAPQAWGALGLAWDHFGSNNLSQDRFRLGWGKAWVPYGERAEARLGLQLDYSRQAFSLDPRIGFSQTQATSAQAFDLGVGLQPEPARWLVLGAAVENLAESNLGVIGTDRLPRRWRLGAAFRASLRDPADLRFELAQRADAASSETQVGAEWKLPSLPLWLRGGADRFHASAGLGFAVGAVRLDYAYQFSGGGAAALPASHALEMGYRWKARAGAGSEPWELARRLARRHAHKGDWQKALHALETAVELNPFNVELRQERQEAQKELERSHARQAYDSGRAAFKRGDLAVAVERYRTAVNLDAEEGMYARALKEAQSQLPKNVPTEEPSVRATLGDVLNLLLEADLYLRHDRLDLAKANWRKVLDLDPKNPVALEKLKVRQKDAGPKARAADERDAEAAYKKGLKAYFRGDLDEAIRDWEEALRLDPAHSRAHNSLLRARMELEGTKK